MMSFPEVSKRLLVPLCRPLNDVIFAGCHCFTSLSVDVLRRGGVKRFPLSQIGALLSYSSASWVVWAGRTFLMPGGSGVANGLCKVASGKVRVNVSFVIL